MSNSNSFASVFDDMKDRGMKIPTDKVFIKIPESSTILDNAMNYFLSLQGYKYVPQPEYALVAKWLADNEGKGLFMYGNCGRGKTILGRYAIPAILLKYCRKVVSCYDIGELDSKIYEALKMHLLSIDDIGTETVAVNYGKKRMPFSEIMDTAEKYGKLVIITSNLNHEDLISRYGERVIDRIKATTTRILFEGKSLRK